MKLRNKKTGEIIETGDRFLHMQGKYLYTSLAELNTEWEDYEEPKKYWFINPCGEVVSFYEEDENPADTKASKAIGDYFDTREEAEKVVEKLRAWKVLKDMGFKIVGIRYRDNKNYIEWSISQKARDDYFMSKAFNDTLHLLFGGEE